jgi:hypothetical protein
MPYWWLKCLVGLKNEENLLVKYYKNFLIWDMMRDHWLSRLLEEFLNPIVGKSIVYYFRRG